MKNYFILLLVYVISFFCSTACKKKINIIENRTFLSILEDSRQSGKTTVPNYYIIHANGSIRSFSFYPLDDERIDYELTSFLEGNTLHYEKHHIFQLSTDSLLLLQSLLIQANLKILSQEIKCFSCIHRKDGYAIVECSTCTLKEDWTDDFFCISDRCIR